MAAAGQWRRPTTQDNIAVSVKRISGHDNTDLRDTRDVLYAHDALWHYPHYRYSDTNQVPQSVLRMGDWKLIKRYEGKPFELFNLREDLSERNDLSALRPDRVRELNTVLEAQLKHAGAKLPRPNPAFR